MASFTNVGLVYTGPEDPAAPLAAVTFHKTDQGRMAVQVMTNGVDVSMMVVALLDVAAGYAEVSCEHVAGPLKTIGILADVIRTHLTAQEGNPE